VKLSKNFDVHLEKLLLKEPSWFEEQSIEIMLDTVGDDVKKGWHLDIDDFSYSILDY
jgi:hypothetical protein